MQHLVSVIGDTTGLATSDEMAAIDVQRRTASRWLEFWPESSIVVLDVAVW